MTIIGTSMENESEKTFTYWARRIIYLFFAGSGVALYFVGPSLVTISCFVLATILWAIRPEKWHGMVGMTPHVANTRMRFRPIYTAIFVVIGVWIGAADPLTLTGASELSSRLATAAFFGAVGGIVSKVFSFLLPLRLAP